MIYGALFPEVRIHGSETQSESWSDPSTIITVKPLRKLVLPDSATLS
jgi:hypothetical protein